MLRLLQVGLGGFGRGWASSVVPEVAGVEAVGYVDIAPEQLTALVETGTTDGSNCYTSLAEALTATKPDAVLVTTTLPAHMPVATEALKAGAHVLTEKPFAPNLADAQADIDLADELGLTLAVSQNYRFFPAVRAVQRIVASGELGQLLSVAIDFRKNTKDWRIKPVRPALAEPLLSDMSIHHFDLMRAVIGADATDIYCRTQMPEGCKFGGPPAGSAILGFDNGVQVSYRGSWINPGPPTTWTGDWSMAFEKGEVAWTSRGEGIADDKVVVRQLDGTEHNVELPTLPAIDRAGSLTEFAAALAEGRAPETVGTDNLRSIAITYAAIESAATGMPQKV